MVILIFPSSFDNFTPMFDFCQFLFAYCCIIIFNHNFHAITISVVLFGACGFMLLSCWQQILRMLMNIRSICGFNRALLNKGAIIKIFGYLVPVMCILTLTWPDSFLKSLNWVKVSMQYPCQIIH